MLQRIFLFLLLFNSFYITIKPELLFVQKLGTKYYPLSPNDKNAAKVIQTIKAYQWPTSIIYTDEMTQQDKENLFGSQSGAEEIVIRKKVRAIDPAYDVIFIPTVIYEIFFLQDYFSEINNVIRSIDPICFDDELKSLIAQNSLIDFNQKSFYESHHQLKELDRVCLDMNNKFIHYLNDLDPKFFSYSDGVEISEQLRNKAHYIAAEIIPLLYSSYRQWIREQRGHHPVSLMSLLQELISDNNELNPVEIISRTIILEYQARETNKALIFRGTDGTRQCLSLTRDQHTKKLDGTMGVLVDSPLVPIAGERLFTYPFEDIAQAYEKQQFKPYSLSFGNSLFAGALFDPGACAYNYFTYVRFGYALTFDKNDYIQHQCNNLFFISPLSTIAGICGFGEFFHSRSKACFPHSCNANYRTYVKGIASFDGFTDHHNFILIEREPLEHAVLLSRFFVENIYFLKSDVSAPTKLFDSHKKALRSYEEIRARNMAAVNTVQA